MDCCRVYIQKQADGNLVVLSQEVETFKTQTKVLCCLDQLMLVKEENEQQLCVINQLSKLKVILPKPDPRWKPNDREGFNILYDGGRQLYMFVHVWAFPDDHLGLKKSKVGCEFIGFRPNVGVVSPSWTSVVVEKVYRGWEYYLTDMVTVKSSQIFWDIRGEDYLVQFDVDSENLKRVLRPLDNVSAKQDASMLRAVFEDRGRLLMSYATPAKAMFYVLKSGSKWQHVKTVQHNEPDLRQIQIKKPLTAVPYPTGCILFKRYLLFNKTIDEGRNVHYFDLTHGVVLPLANFDGYYTGNYRWIKQVSTFTG